MLLLALFACHESNPTPLSAIDDGSASVYVATDDNGAAHALTVQLGSAACPTLSDLEGTANGVPLTLVEPGYMDRDVVLTGTCHYTRLALGDLSGLDPADGLEIVLTDGTDTWTFASADLLAPRGYQLVEPADGTVSAGEAVTLSWFPQSGMFTSYPPEVTDGGNRALAVNDAAADGWDISFTLPGSLDARDVVVVPAAFWRPDVDVCEGLVHCTASEYMPDRVVLPVE